MADSQRYRTTLKLSDGKIVEIKPVEYKKLNVDEIMGTILKPVTEDDMRNMMIDATLERIFQNDGATADYLLEIFGKETLEYVRDLAHRHLIECFNGRYRCTFASVQRVLNSGARYDLDDVAKRVAMILAAADLPISSLIAAAIVKADNTNSALLRRCYPEIASSLSTPLAGESRKRANDVAVSMLREMANYVMVESDKLRERKE